MSLIFLRGATSHINFDWLQNRPASEEGAGGTAAKENLVYVVMKDKAEVFEVITAQTHANLFGHPVADRVRVTDALALDDFNWLQCRRPGFKFANDEIQVCISNFLAVLDLEQKRGRTLL